MKRGRSSSSSGSSSSNEVRPKRVRQDGIPPRNISLAVAENAPQPYAPNEWRGETFPLTTANINSMRELGIPPPDFRENYPQPEPDSVEAIEIEIARSERSARRMREEAQRIEEEASRRRAAVSLSNLQNTAGQFITRATTPIRNALSEASNSAGRTRRLLEPGLNAFASGAAAAAARVGEGVYNMAEQGRIHRLGDPTNLTPSDYARNLEHRRLLRQRNMNRIEGVNSMEGGGRKLKRSRRRTAKRSRRRTAKRSRRRTAKRSRRRTAKRNNRSRRRTVNRSRRRS
jgi:hypothetical protein